MIMGEKIYTPDPKYRDLKDGDIITKDTEFFNGFQREWKRVHESYEGVIYNSQQHKQARRPLSNAEDFILKG